ncbi:amino acid ABC transporter ATP-binding protein [Auritidibacter ignavus]|uniref:amino acid ABC transporter ATP-binding protein n=1 Tax=Auritidibacter ignavus TaxID=678932 RepID=UPI00244BBB9D|nr:amino acid ABC transporter ATP-binding protein [Auritidibacter ignavus]WGH85740.1 amino acid ABC transporter ATP-binding protein [Auritidibacter ignavus]WGH88027.1 amino acid ABC transporter ATP-binding protein [Auritidibacter ignavus]
MASDTSLVHAHGVRKAFGNHEVLRGIDFSVKPGEVSVIIGPSGSGKSTFLRAINGLETLDQGSLVVDDQQVGFDFRDGKYHEWPDKRWAEFRAGIGMVFQRFNLYGHLTAVENVTIALVHVKKMSRSEAKEIAERELHHVGLAEHQHKRPHQLSGGQQQRVAIARALAMEPKLILFDEPTSALDPELVDEVLETMKTLAKAGMTMIVVTHEIGFAREVADTISFFDDGQIVLRDAPEQFFTSDNTRVQGFLERVR